MPTPIYSIPIFTIEQARAVAGVLRGYLDTQAPCDNDPTEADCDNIASAEFQSVSAAWCHLDAFINTAAKAIIRPTTPDSDLPMAQDPRASSRYSDG